MALLQKKPVQAAAAVTLAAAIVLAGTFAWNSFNQNRINVFKELVAPDVNLHDDFEGGPNKDVYVENSGQADIFVRVRLTEFLQTENRGSLVAGQVRDDDKAYLWAPHNATGPDSAGAVDQCVLAAPNQTSADWAGQNFHDYYKWYMGGTATPNGQIYYKPATPEQKGEYNDDGTVVREPVVVSDPLTGTLESGDANLNYTEQVNALTAAGKSEEEAMAELGIGKTQQAYVITMADWVKGDDTITPARAPYARGDFWVIDQADGWAYWANALHGGSATGLLLDKVERTEKGFDSNAEYAINVWLQAVDATDFGEFETPRGGGISENGKKLLQLAAGKIVIAADSAVYTNNGDGSYTLSIDTSGNPVTGAKAFVPLGSQGVNAPVANRLEIGQRVTVSDLAWVDSEYGKYDEALAIGSPWYNMAKTDVADAAKTTEGDQIYQVIGSQIGADKQVYLMLSPVVEDAANAGSFIPDPNETLYLASVTREGQAGGYTYSQTAPGTAPYGFIWPGVSGGIGTATDSRVNPKVTVESRTFSLLGNGVYLETTGQNGGRAAAPTTYFFAGKALNNADLTLVTGNTADEKVTALFPLQLTVGDKFNLTEGAVADGKTPITGYAKADNGAYTMTDLVKGVDGNYYLYLGSAKNGYAAPGPDGFLAGKTTADLHVWDGGMGVGSSTDQYLYPGDFAETFLKGKTSADLAEGKKLTADGYTWTVVEIDAQGNRLLLTDTGVASMGNRMGASRGNYPYASTNWPGRAAAFTNTLTTLKPYAMGVNLPEEQPYLASEIRTASDGLSTCTGSQAGAVAFVPSASDINTYLYANTSLRGSIYSGSIYGLRSQVKNAAGTTIFGAAVYSRDGTFNSDVGLGTETGGSYPAFYDQYHSTNYYPRMALWVRFSDADQLAAGNP